MAIEAPSYERRIVTDRERFFKVHEGLDSILRGEATDDIARGQMYELASLLGYFACAIKRADNIEVDDKGRIAIGDPEDPFSVLLEAARDILKASYTTPSCQLTDKGINTVSQVDPEAPEPQPYMYALLFSQISSDLYDLAGRHCPVAMIDTITGSARESDVFRFVRSSFLISQRLVRKGD
jgi:hypothetical protein